MKKIAVFCAAFCFSLNVPLFSQSKMLINYPIIGDKPYGIITSASTPSVNSSPWPFYPLQGGNFWRYQISFRGGVYGYNHETIVDSILIDGKQFWKKRIQEYTGGRDSTFLRQEDSTYIMTRSLGQYSPVSRDFKIDAANGEKWLAQTSPDDSTNKTWGKLDSTSQIEIFGNKRFSKHYRFWNELNGRLQWTKFITLVDGLGLIRIRGGDGGVSFHDVDLVGAIIGNKQYGVLVSVRENATNAVVPEFFFISYPNPFTTTTIIEINPYDLTSKRIAQLAVYNLIGQHIRTIYHDILQPNRRLRIAWDGRDDFNQRLPGGIYFLQLRTDNLVQIQRTVILR